MAKYKMKSVTTLLGLLCIITTIQAQEDKDQKYALNKITVEVENKYGGCMNWSNWGSWSSFGTFEASQSKIWRAFQGGNEISELTLYKLAGFKEQALEVNNYLTNFQKKKKTWQTIGVVSTILGGGMLVYWVTLREAENWTTISDDATVILGLSGVTLAGVGLGVIIGWELKHPTKLKSASFALEVAEYYNKKLKGF